MTRTVTIDSLFQKGNKLKAACSAYLSALVASRGFEADEAFLAIQKTYRTLKASYQADYDIAPLEVRKEASRKHALAKGAEDHIWDRFKEC